MESEYPVREISITAGDRFVLYTDGLIEPENLNGESFGDRRLGEMVCNGHSLSSSEVSDRLLSELRHWPACIRTPARRHHSHRHRRALENIRLPKEWDEAEAGVEAVFVVAG